MELRRLREESGFLIEAVAQHLECSQSKISRLETGKGIPKTRDVRDMLTLYGVHDEDVRSRLLAWAQDGQQHGWWHDDYSDLLDERLENFIALEAAASVLKAYESNLIHGLLQTRDYARAVLEVVATDTSDPDAVDRWLDLRLRRQEILRRTDSPAQLHVVFEEAAINRPVGGYDVLKRQLKALLEASELPNLTIQVIPLSVGMHAAMAGPYMVLQFAGPTDHDMVFIESSGGGAVHPELQAELPRYHGIFDAISRDAMDPASSTTYINQAISRL